jgi:two-component system CheB/CheR fusion protein
MEPIDFPVVGIGASAGGIKALKEFFDNIDENCDMAFVVITHLAPEKDSTLDELLAHHTSMKVQQVTGKTEIKPGHIYVIPPNKQLSTEGNVLQLAEKKTHQAVIDVFMRSMAEECEKLSIGIILSGTGSDGTLGLKAVKEFGGVTMVQDPEEAKYDGMPQSAINTDLVDFILPVKELAKKVMNHREILGKVKLPLQDEKLSPEERSALQDLFSLLASNKGHDFKHYKRSSVLRRLQRRMYVTAKKSIQDYYAYVEDHPDEITELFKDLLISVTNFFRDPEAFASLKEKVIPKLFKGKSPEDPIRVWVTGCASGEEVYSLAILLHEHAATLNYMPQIKVFGTDISDEALRVARRAIYPKTIRTDVSDKRLQRYFHKENGGYRVCKEIRERVLISNHDILSDPPFLNQDLISCRNLLIYFNKNLQEEVLKIMHYALRPEGFLFLGLADSTIGATNLFSPVRKSAAIYKARQVPKTQKAIPRFPLLPNLHRSRSIDTSQVTRDDEFTFDKVHYSLLAGQYAPPSVIVDENNQVMHSSKGVDNYLSYAEGEPTRDLLKMVAPQVYRLLRNVIFRYNQLDEPKALSKEKKIEKDDGDKAYILKLGIQPIDVSGFPEGFRQITFEKIDQFDQNKSRGKASESTNAEESEIVDQLENELKQTKEQLQQTIEEYETSNEELMASNEELQSMNEELQTTTEELETSKEELQSVNEELRTVNQELENKIDELKDVNDDLKNLMEATEIGIIFLDTDLNLKLFTNNATEIFHLIDSDIGRRIDHVTNELEYDNLVGDIKQMLDTSKPMQQQVVTKQGDWYIMQMKPYQTTEYNADGAVVTFVDITDLKEAEEQLTYRAKNDEALADLGKYILKSTSIPSMMERTVAMLVEQLNVDSAVMYSYSDPELARKLELQALSGNGNFTDNEFDSIELGSNTELDFTLDAHSPVIIDNTDQEDRFLHSPLLTNQRATSAVNVEVSGSQRKVGFLGVYNIEQRTFDEYEINFIQSVANMVGEACERMRTSHELEKAYEELEEKIKFEKQLQRDILEVEEKERWRLGQYLHDETAQNILGVKMLLEILEPQIECSNEKAKQELKKIKQLIVRSEENIRELSHFVLPIEGDQKVPAQFKQLVNQTKELYNIECELLAEDEVLNSITDPTAASSLYYIIQEAIRNAIHHGKADNIEVSLVKEGEVLDLTVQDNGRGYENTEDTGGRGLNIMHHRAKLLGGSIKIETVDTGTVISCSIPMEKV